jgi:chromosome partitioning protein
VRTLAIINQKGGCGKTTTAINLAAVFASKGLRTLLVDLDPQSHCAAGLAIPEDRIERDVSDVLSLPDNRPLDANRLLWRVVSNLDLLPSRTKLAGLEAARGSLAALPQPERRLARGLERLTGECGRAYDVCLIDCSPSIGLLTYNALVAAQEVIVPVETSFFSLQGANKQAATLRSLSRRLSTRQTARFLPTIHDPTSTLARDLLSELRERFGQSVIPGTIRMDPMLREAASFGQPIIDYAPESIGAEDYERLGTYLIERAGLEAEDRPTDHEDLPTIEVLQRTLPPGRPAGRAEVGHARRSDDTVTAHTVGSPGRAAHNGTPAVGAAVTTAPAPRHKEVPAGEPGASAPVGSGPVGQGATATAEVSEASAGTLVEPMSRMEDLFRRAQQLQQRVRETASDPATTVITQQAGPLQLVETRLPARTTPQSITRLFGVRPSGRRVLFVQPGSAGTRVCIAGDFNGWDAESHPMRFNERLGVHELSIELPTGDHAYRIVCDGRWTRDPHNECARPNEFGDLNSIVSVSDLDR